MALKTKTTPKLTAVALSVDETADVIEELRRVFAQIQGPRKDDICYATQNRQDAVRDMANDVDVVDRKSTRLNSSHAT